jgi:biotin transport system ATP-binding protein
MIRVENLVHRFDSIAAVAGVSLSVAPDAFLVVTGPNGSGKTTLVRHFNALLEPDEGTVTLDGKPVVDNPVVARTSVGMVFQNARDQFVAATIGADVAFGPENLGLAREEIDRRVADALAAVNLDGRADERIAALSGGEQARVAVAGALAMEPDYLVLDEPFAGLDDRATRSLLAHLDDLHDAGTAIVLVTHDLRDLLDRADRIVGMNGGAIAVDTADGDGVDALGEIGVRVPRC